MNISCVLFCLLLGRCLPITNGSLNVFGITQSVVIKRDHYGVPHVEAENDRNRKG